MQPQEKNEDKKKKEICLRWHVHVQTMQVTCSTE